MHKVNCDPNNFYILKSFSIMYSNFVDLGCLDFSLRCSHQCTQHNKYKSNGDHVQIPPKNFAPERMGGDGRKKTLP